MFDPTALARPNIVRLKPYSSAREDFVGVAEVYLDANENSLGSPVDPPLNRYPDPRQTELKRLLAARDGVPADSIFVGNGSDEVIDLLIRVFCEPRVDEILICPPTYGIYRVAADVNDVAVREVPLTSDFQLDVDRIVAEVTSKTKLIFICSPNNPTGNLMGMEEIVTLASGTDRIVVVDEAYIDFAQGGSMVGRLVRFPNVVVLRTLSKAYGLAAARVGIGYGDPALIALLEKAKPPYNVSGLAQAAAVEALRAKDDVNEFVRELRRNRERLRSELEKMRVVETVFPSDANFLLVRVTDSAELYRSLIGRGIVVRDRSREFGCENCLRITVGNSLENQRLIDAIKEYSQEAAG